MKLNKNGTCIRYLFYPNKKDLDPTHPSPPPNKNYTYGNIVFTTNNNINIINIHINCNV